MQDGIEDKMARVDHKRLFFTTSPRTPEKMIPEIRLLVENFSGEKWNEDSQAAFMDLLWQADFFEGKKSAKSKAKKAWGGRDRINRNPRALGFVNLKPNIELTEAGDAFVYGKRPKEIFLRQILKFQLPSPYHKENKKIRGTFYIRPYLEILRLIREMEYLTFDEFKIFVLQMTDYRKYEEVKENILQFREDKQQNKGRYKLLVQMEWENAILNIFKKRIAEGNIKTRETRNDSLKKFIDTQKRNMRDYADACFRCLRYTGLVAVSHKNYSISIFTDKIPSVDFILATVEREPIFVNDVDKYKEYLFSSSIPELYDDNKNNIIDAIMRMSSFTKRELQGKTIKELKDLRDKVVTDHRNFVISKQITEIKSYALYSEIIDTFNEIISDEIYDAPLIFEYNTWRAMTMLDGGKIKGNFSFDDNGHPLFTALGNMPDIECDYTEYSLTVEVTLQSGQRQYEAEGESVARHYGQLKKRAGKDTYCLFIAPIINPAVFAHFFVLNKVNVSYYGGKAKIIPLELEQFMRLVENAYNYRDQPNEEDLRFFLDKVIQYGESARDENEWRDGIQECVMKWLQ